MSDMLDFGSFTDMSDDEFESHLNSDTRAEVEGYAERDELAEAEANVERLRKQRQGKGSAGERLNENQVEATPQTIVASLSGKELAQVLKAVNTADDGSPALNKITDQHELIDALSDNPSSEPSEQQMKRIMAAIGKSSKAPKHKKSAMDLNDDEFEKVLHSKNVSDMGRNRGEGKNWLEQRSDNIRNQQNDRMFN